MYIFHTLTMIDPVTGWFKMIDIPNKSSVTVLDALNNSWLCRYPYPQYVGCDNGSDFMKLFAEINLVGKAGVLSLGVWKIAGEKTEIFKVCREYTSLIVEGRDYNRRIYG